MLEDAKQVRAAATKKLLTSSWRLFVVPVVVYLTEIVKEIQPHGPIKVIDISTTIFSKYTPEYTKIVSPILASFIAFCIAL